MTLLILYFCLAIFVSFFCSLMEAVILSLSHAHVELMIKAGRPSGRILKAFKNKIDRPLAAILTLNTVANTVGAAGVGAQSLVVFGSKWVALASAILTFTILVFSEIIPKTLGAVYWKKLAPPSAYVIRVLIWIAWPFVVSFEVLGRFLSGSAPRIRVTREEMVMAADMGRAEGQLVDRERRVIKNLLRLDNIPAKDIMTPRSVMFALSREFTVSQVIRDYSPLTFSRIPVYGLDRDDISGLVYRAKLNQAVHQGRTDLRLEELASPIYVVPGLKSVSEVLDEFIRRREHLFLVVDEYGGTAGLITLEDCIETLLGEEIVDELDSVEDMQKFAREMWEKKKKAQIP